MSRTIVVFRKYKEGDIIALFPEQIGKNFKVNSYMHFGQHADANYYEVIRATKLAKPEEYAELKQELESVGYKSLDIRKKWKVRF